VKGLVKPLTAGLGLACLLPLNACSTTYRAEPIEAWVVDAKTARPIGGVVVAAHWELEIGEVFRNSLAGQLMVLETMTDQNGRMYFPGWGPKSVPSTLANPLKTSPHLERRAPEILLFKPGYRCLQLTNALSTTYSMDSVRKSDWNGKTIKMDRFLGNSDEYALHLTQLSNSMGYAFRAHHCEWKETPRLLSLLFSEANELQGRGVYVGGIRDAASLPNQGECGSAQEFFKDHPK